MSQKSGSDEMPRTIRYVGLTIGLLIIAALLTYAYLGTSARMIADDYCRAYDASQYGVIKGVIERYNTWSSRYSTHFIEYALAPLQPAIHPILPTLLIVGWFTALFMFFTPLAESLKLPHPQLGAALLSLILTYVLTNSVPSPQNIYWFGATIPYVLPLILLLAYVGGLLRYFRQPRSLQQDAVMVVIHAVMVWLLCGFAETIITSVVTLHGLALLAIPFVPRTRRRSYSLIVIGGLVAGLAGLVFAMTAPGIALRQARVNEVFDHERISILRSVLISIVFTGLFMTAETFGLAHMLFLFLTVFVGLIVYYRVYTPDEVPPQLPYPAYVALLTLGSCCLVIMSVAAPSIYALGFVASRTLVIARLAQMLMVVVLAYLSASAAIRRNWVSVLQESRLFKPVVWLVVMMMAFLPLLTIGENLTRIPEFRAYARDWDARHAILVAAEDGAVVEVPELEYNIEDYLLLDRMAVEPTWVNDCVANFYHLKQIIVDAVSQSQ